MGTAHNTFGALSPLDGRYSSRLQEVSLYFSEFALFKYRLICEVRYLQFFLTVVLKEKVSKQTITIFDAIIDRFDEQEVIKVREFEDVTHHDVKAVEYYLREKLTEFKLPYSQYIHIGLTSEDTNSIAYGLMLQDGRKYVLVPALRKLVDTLVMMSEKYTDTSMLARTHGQPAVPTTVGKELINVAVRVYRELSYLEALPIEAKMSGAVGNFNAHVAAYPDTDWVHMSSEFIRSLGLTPNVLTTQIIPADAMVKVFSSVSLINTILLGFSQDMWRYISDGYFVQTVKNQEVGSSTMPQKVNPIHFENAEGNLGLANSLLAHFVSKLPISRLQRDLSDSTVKRSIGTAIGHSVLAYESMIEGLSRVSPDTTRMTRDLLDHWEVVTEGIQTILRSSGDIEGYEKTKAFFRGRSVTKDDVFTFIESLSATASVKHRLHELSPLTYTGLASKLVTLGVQEIHTSHKKISKDSVKRRILV